MVVGRSVGIVGTGPIGQGLATLWADAGYDVTLGARSAASAAHVTVPGSVTVGTFEDAARHDTVVLAVRHDAAADVATRLAPHLEGTLVLDTMNAVTIRDGRAASALDRRVTEGQWLEGLLPGSVVVRAFSHIQDELLVSRARKNPGVWAVGYATDASDECPRIEQLITDTGYSPVFAGTLAQSSILDPGGAAFPRLLTYTDLRGLVTVHRLPEMLDQFNTGTIGGVLHEQIQWVFPYGPTIGVGETFRGRQAVTEHLARVQASGVRIENIRTELETTRGAVVHATGLFPTPNGVVTSPIVSTVIVQDGLISEVREYWDTAAIR
ncbi:MAG: NAD(P)-binding domain-containing protein [Gordonia sp. (in: high G+C Gram-positive bacteria)]